MLVSLPVEKLGSPLQIIDMVDQPWGVAVNQNGDSEVVVAEKRRNCISIFSPTGKRIRSLALMGLVMDSLMDLKE